MMLTQDLAPMRPAVLQVQYYSSSGLRTELCNDLLAVVSLLFIQNKLRIEHVT